MNKYNAHKMIKRSRHINYFNSLDHNYQKEILNRIEELIIEEKEYIDRGNYSHLCNIFSAISIYEILQRYNYSQEEAFNTVSEEMYKFIQKSKRKFQKLSTYSFFWPIMKIIIPIGFKYGSGIGWRYTWLKNKDKNIYKFETNECIYQKIFKKRHLEELGPMFCKCDIINYGELSHIDFQRKGTLCYGDDKCDFQFVRHSKDEEFKRTESK